MSIGIRTVNQRVIDALRQGNIPWKTFDLGFPASVFSHARYGSIHAMYGGINPILLQLSAQKHNFNRSRYWGSFPEWRVAQCSPLPGHGPTFILGHQEFERDGECFTGATGSTELFNADQVFGLTLGDFIGKQASHVLKDYSKVETLIGKSDVNVTSGSTALYYDGTITMPSRYYFKDDVQYWATWLHELCHHWEAKGGWMGDGPQRELVAEIVTGYLEGLLGYQQCDDRINHDKYFHQWLSEAEKTPSIW